MRRVLFVLLLASCDYGDVATRQARDWVESNYRGERFQVSCMGRDTDGDGYVSCTAAHQPAESGTRMPPIGLQCSTQGMAACGNEGCKLSVVR